MRTCSCCIFSVELHIILIKLESKEITKIPVMKSAVPCHVHFKNFRCALLFYTELGYRIVCILATITYQFIFVLFSLQICDLKFGSYQFDTEQMDVQPLSDKVKSLMGIAKYEENGEWDLIDERVDQGTVCHAFSNNTAFSQLSYKLLLRRKPLYYIANFVIPCVLIAMVTILLFLIPPGRFFVPNSFCHSSI